MFLSGKREKGDLNNLKTEYWGEWGNWWYYSIKRLYYPGLFGKIDIFTA